MAFLHMALDIIVGAQAEIAVFVVAVVVHALFFGMHRVKAKGPKVITKSVRGTSQNREEETGLHLIRAVKPLLRAGANEMVIRHAVRCQLQGKAHQEKIEALTCLLEACGQASTPALLAVTRAQLREIGAWPCCGKLGELLLRCYYHLRMQAEFSQALNEVESVNGSTPGSSVLALRAAVDAGDLEGALHRLKDVSRFWQEIMAATPAAGFQVLMQRLVSLAVDKAAVPTLLQEFRAHDLLQPAVLEAALVECCRRADTEGLREAEACAKEAGVKLAPAACLALIRGGGTAAEALRLLGEADHASPPKELFLALCDTAAVREDAALAQFLLEQLPVEVSAEVAGAVIGLASKGLLPSQGTDPRRAVLQLFEEKFGGLSLGTQASAAFSVAEAALLQGRPDLLCTIVASSLNLAQQVAMLKRLGTSKRLQDAFKLFQACPEKPSCIHNALLEACVECEDWQAAQKVFREAQESGSADVITANTIIKAHLVVGDVQRARQALEELRAAGLQPNAVTYNELLDSAIQTDIKLAWAVIDEMEAEGIAPNSITCSILLKGVQANSHQRYIERVMGLVGSVSEEMDEVLLGSVCEACIRCGRGDLLAEQLARQRTPRRILVRGAAAFGSLIRAYGFMKDVDGIWQTWQELRAHHVVPTSVTLGCMVEALVNNTGPEAGYEMICEANSDVQFKPLINAVIYCSVLKGFSHQKRFDRMWSVYQEMMGARLKCSIVTYNTLVDACARCGEMHQIPTLLLDMENQGIVPNLVTYGAILKGYCQEGQLDRAFQLMEELKQNTKFRPDEITYNTLLDGCARQGMYAKGMTVLEEMQVAGVHPSNFTLSVLVKLAHRSRQLEAAFHLCETLSQKYGFSLNIHVYNNLMNACVGHRQASRALGVFENCLQQKVQPDSRSYAVLLRGLLAVGEVHETAGLLRAAVGLRAGHKFVARFGAAALRPRGGLASPLVSELLEGIAASGGDLPLAVQLFRELHNLPNLHLDPKLAMRLASKAADRFSA